MGHLSNRNIIIGVSGGIAAYKAAELIRLFRKAGAAVRVIMTRGAQEFITPLTLQALSGQPVHTELLDEEAELGMGHIELARWADAMLIAPATADIIARLASGRADDLLTTVALATPAPLWVAPAMNQQMWANPATTANIERLKERQIRITGPDAGEQACGDVGPGRLLDPEEIVQALAKSFDLQGLAGRRVVVTAGPTREAIDPVRYISNHSSGKMGFAIARAAAEAGAYCVLIAGPVNLLTPEGVIRVDVESADAMMSAVEEQLSGGIDLFIAAAAVADYKPLAAAEQKIKKSSDTMTLQLVKNPDIVSHVANSDQRPAVVVGFAAETEKVLEHARDKLERKGLDAIVANDVSRADIGFNSDNNAVTIINRTSVNTIPAASKQVVAQKLIDEFSQMLGQIHPARDNGRGQATESEGAPQ
ncbi:MAG: bifunctional phosphopantothenoylcysteine decarboxylase/phosphopantothenate--cysteine ligase CoaBC [Pseudomonadota bacterium]